MNKIIYILKSLFILALIITGCKDGEINAPSFEVKAEQLSYKVGDTPRFEISGYADYIAFYSGNKIDNYPNLLGNRYQYKDRVTAEGNAFLEFKSILQNPDQQQGTLSVLVSSDFAGIYDSTSVVSATWNDITDRITLSNGVTGTAVSSGKIDISDFNNKPFVLAFKYVSQVGTKQPTWTISNLSVNFYTKSSDLAAAMIDTFTVATLNPVWQAVSISNPAQVWTRSNSQLKFSGGNIVTKANEDWVISSDYYLNRVPTDKAIPIKSYTDEMLQSYEASPYSKAGEYKVTFVGINADAKDQSSVEKSFTITVTP